MKKLLPIALLAAISCSFVACDEGDVACFEPSYNKIITDMSNIRGADKDLATLVSSGSLTVDGAVEPCKNFAEDVKTIVDKNKDVTGDSIKSEWEDFKKTGTACKIKYGAVGILNGLSFPTIYDNIEKNITYCSDLTVAGAAVVGDEAKTSFTTMSGWHNMLTAAANMTAE